MNIYVTYKCNFHCPFCSIRKDASPIINLDWVHEELNKHPELCSNINILGGEPSVTSNDFQEKLINICTEASGDKPYYITNLYKISPFLDKCKPIVSYDFDIREKNEVVLNNILNLDMDFSLSTVLTDHLVNKVGSSKYIRFISSLKHCNRADLDLYYKGKEDTNDFTPDNESLLSFIKDVITNDKVNLAPLSAMKNNIDSSFNNISDYFAFTPYNEYGVRLDYRNGPYRIFDTYEEAKHYYDTAINNSLCNKCEFINTCWYPCSDTACHGNKPMLEMFKRYVFPSSR